jgi:hypothetical protein
MKTLLHRCLVSLTFSIIIAWPRNAQAQETAATNSSPIRYIIGLSPFLEKSVKDDIYRRIIGFLLTDVPLNSSLGIYDGFSLTTITQMEIPNARAFKSGKTRANQFKEQIAKLREFLATDHPKPGNTKLPLAGAIRFPQFLDFAGQNLASTSRPVVLILLGNPLYIDPKEPAFAMVDGYFPSDGHLLASREKSVFGIKDRARALENISVYFGYSGDPWVSELHQEKIARFWALYLQGQGSKLMTFCGDPATLFNSVRPGAPLPDNKRGPWQIDPSQTKIEMLRITRDIGVADWITRDFAPARRQAAPSITVGPMKIGIRWKGDIDLDLYATPHSHADTLFFEHTRSAEGYYYKDHRSSPDREFEFVEFEAPVDVWKIDAAINFYKGSAPEGARGEVRVEFDSKIYSGDFSISAPHGNEGRSGNSQREFWTQIDLPKILKLQRVATQTGINRSE